MESSRIDAGGLSDTEAQARLLEHGYNEIREMRSSPLLGVARRLWGPIPWMLEAALILELALGKRTEPAMIAAWLLFSAVVGSVQEQRAQKVLDLLRSRLRVVAHVCRDGAWRAIAARELVPGDRIRVRPGDVVPADCAIDQGAVEADQSALTGESAVVSRSVKEVLYSASTVQRGEATAIVTATGAKSYYGRTAELVRSARAAGHLDKLLFAVVRHLVVIDAVLAIILMAFALWSGTDLLVLIPFLLVLVIATVPVTMPAAFTVANAVEARILARQGILVTGLSAVQEAATMDVLCIDKTGTLTENRQTLVEIVALDGAGPDEALAWAAAACDDSTQGALESAILEALSLRAIQPLERTAFAAFDPAVKYATATVSHKGQAARILLGSPHALAAQATPSPDLEARVEQLAADGARVLAVATDSNGEMRIRGLLALADIPRRDAAELVSAVRRLGVRVLMVSGDTAATARAVARKVGIGDHFGEVASIQADPLRYDGFANCYPQDKIRLVETLQGQGRIVGMTGDGVNDSPALKQAEVGIAVSTASDVAKASAQIVLTRAGLQDMVAVIHGGRRVYRRMLTWTITKIARTVELAALLVIGYIMAGFFVTSLLLIALLVILNDIVTITLATDRAWISPVPERWNVKEIGKVASIFAIGWLSLGLAILWFALHVWNLRVAEIQTLMFAYLIYSAQTTIYSTRVRGRFWSYAPSPYVVLATLGNAVIATIIGLLGVLATPVAALPLFATLAAVIIATFAMDEIKLRFLRRNDMSAATEAGASISET